MQYNAWKGQLYIREQLVCDITLQASSACSIPAQLSDKLELKEVIQLSELRKKLPGDLFQKTDSTGQEVSCGNIYYSLYSVVASNIVGSELDKLCKYLKDQDLALIKVLNDQGFLILVNSAVLRSNTDIREGNAAQLNAAFLFPHKKVFDEREREEWEAKFVRKELPATIANLLPGLHFAILESSKLQKDKALYPGPLVEQYFRKYAHLQSKKGNLLESKPEHSEAVSVFYSHGVDLPTKCSQLAFSCLQLYVSSPVNFSVPLLKMSNILAENASLSSNSDLSSKTIGNLKRRDNQPSASKLKVTVESKAESGRVQGKRAAPEEKKEHSKKATKRKTAKRGERKSKRKSSHRAALTTAETGENQTSNKRRRLHSEEKKQTDSPKEATVKLAAAPYSQRRTRGAEVLTAAIIHDEKIQASKKVSPSKADEENKSLTKNTKAIKRKGRKIVPPEELALVPDKPSKRKASNPGKKKISAGVTSKPDSMRRTNEINSGKTPRASRRNQGKIKNITVEQIGQPSETLRDVKKPSPPHISEESMMEKRISMYESHALNLLADLALNSFGTTNLPYIRSANASLVEEAPVEHPLKDCRLPEPEHLLESDKPKNGLNVSPRKRMENSEKHMSPKAHIAAAKAKARFNATSKISLEHSYSQLPMEDIPGKSARETCEQTIQVVPDSTTLVDVVLEPSTIDLPVLLTSDNVCPATDDKPRAVSTLQDNFAITFHWEPKYNFDLDSKFTSDPLEKTINRALHGPWNYHLKEKVEDVKIILHMWIALFYSKTNKQISFSSRKVVEHSNPAKYVSINTVLDPFEFYELVESDHVQSADDTTVILPKGKKSEALSQVNPPKSIISCKLTKSDTTSLQDFTVPSSIPTKDYNIKLASEIFQMYRSNERACDIASLQTSMTCKLAPSSGGAQTPANVMPTIFGTNVPTVCYIGDTDLFNTELADKSENCMDIGGFPSEKAMEHKYFKDFSSISDAQKSDGSQTDRKIGSANVNEEEQNVKLCGAAGSTSQTHGDILHLHRVTLPPTTGDGHKTASNLDIADKKWEYLCAESKTIHSPEIPTADDVNKGIADEDPASVELSSDRDENSGHLAQEDELAPWSGSNRDVGISPSVGHHKTADSQDLQPASLLLGLKDNLVIANKPGESPNIALQSTEGTGGQMAITDGGSVVEVGNLSDHNDMTTVDCMKSCNTMDPLNGEVLKRDQDSSGINESNLRPQEMTVEGLESSSNPDLSKNKQSNWSVDYNRNCTEEGKRDSVGNEDGQEKASENVSDESGKLVQSKDVHNPAKKVLNEGPDMCTTSSNCESENEPSYEMRSTDLMSKLELSQSSDDASDMESAAKSCTIDCKASGEQENINKSSKDSSEKTDGKEEHSRGDYEIGTSVAHSMPVINRDKSLFPERDLNVPQTDGQESGRVSEASKAGEAENEVPEKAFLTLNSAQPGLADDADHLNVVATDEGVKETEPSNHDVNLNSDGVAGSLPEASRREVSSIQGKPATDDAVPLAEDSDDEACLVGEYTMAGAKSSELDGTSVLEDLDLEGSSERCSTEVSFLSEKHEGHVHEEETAESQNCLLKPQAPFQGEMIKNNKSSVENKKQEEHLPGSEVKEMQIDALLAEVETQTCQAVVNNSVNSGLSKDSLEGNPEKSNEETLPSNTTNSVRSQSMIQGSKMDSEPVEKQQPDTMYLCSLVTPTKTSLTPSSRNSSNKKEFLSKLKRICLGSTPGHMVSSSSENSLSRDENCIAGGFTGKKIEVIDLVKTSLSQEEGESTLENCDAVAEEPPVDHLLAEESVITTVDFVEPETLEGEMPSQDNCLISPSLEDVSDGIEQDLSLNLPDICFIVNTGSISKEQYDRWSETSDEDIEYIRSSKEPLPHQEPLQEEIHTSSSLFLDQEQTITDKAEQCFSRPPDSSSGVYNKQDEYLSRSLQDLDHHHENVVVTKNTKDPVRAVQTISKESSSRSDLDYAFSNRRMVSDDLTQNTLDMENVRFACKLKETLRKSSTDKVIHGSTFQTMFESRRILSCSNSTTKCRNPLLITMHCPHRRTDFRRHGYRYPSAYNSSPYYEDELWSRPVTYSRTIRNVRTPRYSPFHFSRLRYENTLDKSDTDISVILNECVQSNHLKLSSIGLGSTAIDRTPASQLEEEVGWQARRTSVPVSSKSHSVKNMISDLCMSLHSRLQNVARVSEQQISFYIYENDDADFISSAKSLLVKDGHIPADPQDFLNSEHPESQQFLVIIKNEDVFSSIHKIPYLMQLKLLPNVTFAGVDSPEDLTESAYEVLFQVGGFVASDKSVLESITLGKLKEVLAILEKMSRTSPWKWLIHYRENRKLKDDKRAEARTKMSLLKSYQQSNVIEILPYHQCDSRSKESSNELSCLLNLQYQHIHSRLAVHLTGTTSTVTEEYEQNGILVYDVDSFLRKIQKVDSQFQASSWS
ncbi:protein TASOR 2 isoform X2 [Eleutherodactylus coqui]|uniref:protein TASOR 2 isoform X2 n=1 Tax=Eleutherodactylus coqui TaxID=57060 RepID=UPI0034635BC1